MVYRQTQLYKFLDYCNKSSLEKKVLDCGAGGDMPPLGMFYNEDYKTIGIEIDDNQIALSSEFEKRHNIKLNIIKGDIKGTIKEFKRVLKTEGLCYINFLSIEDCRYGEGIMIGKDEFMQKEYGSEIIHSYFNKEECDSYFDDMEIIYKEFRLFNRIYEGRKIKQGYIDYIVKKL